MTNPPDAPVTPVPVDAATPVNAPVLIDLPVVDAPAPAERLAYRLLTGPDDRAFCARVSEALADGYRLYGSPSATFNGERVIVAQAVVLDERVRKNGTLR